MDWPTQTRAISTIHSVLREQAKVYPADTIVYPVATIHSMKSLLEKEHKCYSLEFTLSKTNFMETIKKIKEPFSFHLIDVNMKLMCRTDPACPVLFWPCYSSVNQDTLYDTQMPF